MSGPQCSEIIWSDIVNKGRRAGFVKLKVQDLFTHDDKINNITPDWKCASEPSIFNYSRVVDANTHTRCIVISINMTPTLQS